jgi:predicted acetyltransferase
LSFEVRPCATPEEFDDAFMAIGQYFGAEPEPERRDRFLRVLPLERMHAARENGAIVGGAGVFPFEMAVPGGNAVPCAGVTVVGVYPTHRRRGVLRAMMRAQLDDVHERGEPLAALWASEETIYGRYGYGLASHNGSMTLPREYSEYAQPFERRGSTRLVALDEARELFPTVYDRACAVTPGMTRRSADWWELRTLSDQPWQRQGAGPKRFVVLELDGRPAGYAIYRHAPDWGEGIAKGETKILEAIADDGQATVELWRYLLDIDWSATAVAQLLPVDHPLFFLLASPRRMQFRIGDGLWLRIVDVGAALSERRYAVAGSVVFDLADDFCEWNAGRWKVEGDGATRSEEEPEIRLDVQALGSVYLGGFTFAELARAGRVEELREGSLTRADAMFHGDRAPWSPEIF